MNPADNSDRAVKGSMQHAVDVDAATRSTIGVVGASDIATMHQHFRYGVELLGGERAWFVSVDCNGGDFGALCMQSACDPAWTRRYLDESLYRSDPWLSYARRHVEPLVASRLNGLTDRQRGTVELAAAAGFVSCALVPAHADIDPARFGLLVLGHKQPDYFEGGNFSLLRIRGRTLALELHAWWVEHRRREKVAAIRLTHDDLVLLELHAKGRNSDEIAAALHVTRQSINSRFQRLNKRLHVPNRRAAAQVALECGLIKGQ